MKSEKQQSVPRFEVGDRVKGKGNGESEIVWVWTVLEVFPHGDGMASYDCASHGEMRVFWEDQIERARLQ